MSTFENLYDPYSHFQSTTLANGLSLYALPLTGCSCIAITVLVHSGGFQDPVGKEGAAHFLEHITCKSVPLFGDFTQLGRHLQGLGGSAQGAWTNFLCMNYAYFLPADVDTLREVLDTTAQMLLAPCLTAELLEAERKAIQAEYRTHYPHERVRDLLEREVRIRYANLPSLLRAPSVLGTEETIAEMTVDDLRSFSTRHFTPANISIVATGKIDLRQLVQVVVGGCFNVRREGARTAPQQALKEVPRPEVSEEEFALSDFVLGNSTVCRFQSKALIPGTIPSGCVEVIRRLLYEDLFDELRTRRGWGYSVSVRMATLKAVHEFEIEPDGLPLAASSEISTLVTNAIERLHGCEQRFRKALEKDITSYFVSDPSATSLRDSATRDLYRHGRIRSYREEVEILLSITQEDFEKVLEYLRPEHRYSTLLR